MLANVSSLVNAKWYLGEPRPPPSPCLPKMRGGLNSERRKVYPSTIPPTFGWASPSPERLSSATASSPSKSATSPTSMQGQYLTMAAANATYIICRARSAADRLRSFVVTSAGRPTGGGGAQPSE